MNSSAPDHTVSILFGELAENSEAAFKAIYDTYKTRFFAAAYKVTRSQHVAEEIVQEVFVTLWNKRTLVTAANNPESYLITILQNTIYMHFRRLARQRQLQQQLGYRSDEIAQAADELLFEKENQQRLETFIKQLPPQQQTIYRLSKQQGLSREAIAQQLNLSPNTVRNHLAEAMKFIRSHFSEGAMAVILFIIQKNR